MDQQIVDPDPSLNYNAVISSNFDKIWITNNPKLFWQPSTLSQKSFEYFRSDLTSSPTQIPLCAVVNMGITCSNACSKAGILSIKIIISLE